MFQEDNRPSLSTLLDKLLLRSVGPEKLLCDSPLLYALSPDTQRRLGENLKSSYYTPSARPYQYWMRLHTPTAAEKRKMRRSAALFAKKPLISVVVPVYRSNLNYLQQAITSVLGQAYPYWELLMIDDGSEQAELRECLERAAARDQRVKTFYNESNQGIAKTLNRVFNDARGEYVLILDHDDVLEPHALFEFVRHVNKHPEQWDLVYADDALMDEAGEVFYINFKPGFSMDLLLSHQYIVHPVFVRRELLTELGGCREEYPTVCWDYELWLRIAARSTQIAHIPKVLYRWRHHPGMSSRKEEEKVEALGTGILQDIVREMQVDAEILPGDAFNYYRVKRRVRHSRLDVFVIAESDARLLDTTRIQLERALPHKNCRIVAVTPNNINQMVSQSSGDELLFITDGVIVNKPGSLEALLEHAQRTEVGAVGSKIVSTTYEVLHAGLVIGMKGCSAPLHSCFPEYGPDKRLPSAPTAIRNYSAVSSLGMMTRREVFEELGGFDESLSPRYRGPDYCLRLKEKNLAVVYTPYAEFKLIGTAIPEELQAEFSTAAEGQFFRQKWKRVLEEGDPFFNPNLSLWHHDYRPHFKRGRTKETISIPQPTAERLGEPLRFPAGRAAKNAGALADLQQAIARHPEKIIFTAPIYNCYPLLLHSLQLQCYPNWTLLLVHDGPCRPELLRQLKMVNDPRVLFFETKKHYADWGHSLRHLALEYIKDNVEGDYIVMTNADNYHVPAFCTIMLAGLKKTTVQAAYCDMVHNFYKWKTVNSRLEHGFIDCGCIMAKREAALRVGWRDRGYSADWTYIKDICDSYGLESVKKVEGTLLVHN